MSTINVNNLSGKGGATPNLPDGAVISGVATVTNLKPTNVNVSGAVTATTFDGSLKSTGTPTLGLGVTINSSGIHVSGVATVGVLTGGTYYGDGSNLTGVGETIAPHYYNPPVNGLLTQVDTGIGVTFNKKIESGSGTATLKIVNAGTAGTTIQSWGVSSCTFGVTDLTFGSLVSGLTVKQTYQVDIPATFVDDSGGSSYVGTAWTFTTEPAAGLLFTWGYGDEGMLGLNQGPSGTAYSSPVQVPGTTWGETSFSGGPNNGKVNGNIRTDGTLWMWGVNGNGQLAQNHVAARSSPTQVPGTTWSKLSVGALSAAATKTDGTLWMWGYDNKGQLGQNAVVQYSSPVQIPGSTWVQPFAGNTFSFATRTDGTLWAWGQNEFGTLGLNSVVKYSSPVQVPGTWASFEGGNNLTAMGTKTDGTLWMWGYNDKGFLGQNNRTNYSSPVQIPGTNWSVGHDINDQLAIAVKTDGTLWTWGDNEKGQLGQSTAEATKKSSPAQIPGTSWSQAKGAVTAGSMGPMAVRTDGTLWVWGTNNQGQLGLSQAESTDISSPVQIPGTQWVGVKKNYYSVYAMQRDTTP